MCNKIDLFYLKKKCSLGKEKKREQLFKVNI